jgi:hypothetical protein
VPLRFTVGAAILAVVSGREALKEVVFFGAGTVSDGCGPSD